MKFIGIFLVISLFISCNVYKKENQINNEQIAQLNDRLQYYGSINIENINEYEICGCGIPIPNFVYEEFDINKMIERNVQILFGIPPELAVRLITSLDDNDALMILLKAYEIMQVDKNASMVIDWLSLMEPERSKYFKNMINENIIK